MDCYGVYRDSFFTHANKLGISFFCPRCIGIGMFLPAGIYRIDRLAAKAFVCLEIFFQTLYILVAQIGETADVHVVRKVIEFNRDCKRVLLDTSDEIIVVFIF